MVELRNKCKDNPKLGCRVLSDGRISLFLEYYLGRESEPILDGLGNPVLYECGKMAGRPKYKVRHIRRKESLNLYLTDTPKTSFARQQNRMVLQLAKRIRQEREQELLELHMGYRLKQQYTTDILGYFQRYIDNYTMKDFRVVRLALHRFKDFLNETPKYRMYAGGIQAERLSAEMIHDFTDYLRRHGKGEGPRTIYQRFKKVIRHAVEHDVMSKNPCTGISIQIDENMLRKEVLSMEEVGALVSTWSDQNNPDICRAFLFCLYTGMRFCDVRELRFTNVDRSNRLLRFEQSKTRGRSANSGVVIPLNEWLIELIGRPADRQGKDSLIFPLPCYAKCLKVLRKWVSRAGIDKHITWHCGRHSFAVNILNNGANIKTVASLLGHSGLKHTEKYTRAVDKLKEEAINSLPTFVL